jgi:hypothetical protein
MTPQRYAFAAVAVVAMLVLSAPPVHAWGALAVGSCHRYGTSYDYATRERAKNVALANCPGDCDIKRFLKRHCAAFAVDAANGPSCSHRGWARARTLQVAQALALLKCRAQGGNYCVIRARFCDHTG